MVAVPAELPLIVSLDDHVVEPPHVWTSRLPAKLVEAGPRVVRDRGVRAVCFTEMPPNLGLPSIHSGYWDPFFAACDATSTVVFMHIGSGSKLTTSSPDAPMGVTIALTFNNAMVSLTDWLLSGVLARYPKLKLVYSESQVGWMPFLLERLDKLWVNSRAWAGIDGLLPERPSSYMPGRVFGQFFDDDTGLDARHTLGVGQIMFETDYPHQDTTWPRSRDKVAKYAEILTPYELDRIIRGNAIDLLGLTFR